VATTIVWPAPAGELGREVARELAWTYRQFGQIIGPRPVRETFIGDRIRPERVIAAIDDGQLFGYLAIRMDGTGPFTFGAADFRHHFGSLSGTCRALALRVLERREQPDEIFIDGFLVSAQSRGGGIGAKLLEAGERIGREAGKRVFRVRVRGDNPRAASFYKRQGFAEEGPSEITWLARLVGIGPVATYAKPL
jgi:ribosomal protein S18 acetylase RimI-like enzyme